MKAKEDARFVLPGGAESKIIVSMNCRALWNFFELRGCSRAQWEIRKLANEMLVHCQKHCPIIFGCAGPKCERLGYCPEDEKFCCGKYSTNRRKIIFTDEERIKKRRSSDT